MKEINDTALADLSLPIKSLFTGYLLVIGLGLLMAGAQIMQTHGMADGKFGLSVDDIVYSYHGNHEGENASKLEAKLNGSMKENAPPEARMTMIKWARAGAPDSEWETTIKPIVMENCDVCHANMPGLSNIADKDVMMKMVAVDEGAAISTLTRVSHIHLFGIAFIFFFVGWIFSFATGFSSAIKSLLIAIPFAFLILDVMAWWLTKLNPGFAWAVIIGGFGYSVASTVMIFTSLYQMWMPAFLKKKS
ncbi:MAG TPA: elongation factor-1 alpha [Gallionella sp.]